MDRESELTLDLGHNLRRGKRLARHVWKHFQEDRCFEEAASLGYTSLLAMVPLLAVVFGIVAAFPVFNEWSERLQSFIFDNFMPATGEQIVPLSQYLPGQHQQPDAAGNCHVDCDGFVVDGADRGGLQPDLAGSPQPDADQPDRDVLGRSDPGADF